MEWTFTFTITTRDLKQGLIDTKASVSQNISDEVDDQRRKQVTCMRDSTSLLTPTKIKYPFSKPPPYTIGFFSQPLTICHGMLCIASFPSLLLKSKKVSKSEGTKKVEYAHHF